MMTLFSRFAGDESGVTAIEDGLIAALIAVAIITTVSMVGNELMATLDAIAANLT